MSRLDEAKQLLIDLGMPPAQCNERSALTLLALAGVSPQTPWKAATQQLLRTVDVMDFIATQHQKKYAPNSRETFRRQTLHQFRPGEHHRPQPGRPNSSYEQRQ